MGWWWRNVGVTFLLISVHPHVPTDAARGMYVHGAGHFQAQRPSDALVDVFKAVRSEIWRSPPGSSTQLGLLGDRTAGELEELAD